MNYTKIYNNLINRGKSRVVEGYTEKHHILPKCMGGDDSEKNLVSLTPEEHYLAHLLLVKIHPNNYKLAYAANIMCCDTQLRCKRGNKKYGWLKRKLAKALSTRRGTFTGKTHSLDSRQKMSNSQKGRRRFHRDKKVYQYALDNKLIKTWSSLKEAKQSTKIQGISHCACGRHKTAGGYIWSYLAPCVGIEPT